jgi:hypothetical protein
MTLQVIGAGVGRTGTESLKLALEQLLAAPCYHMYEAFKRPSDFNVWTEAARGHYPDWNRFFAGFEAAVDAPVAAFWPELMQAYPEALILLSVRDTDGWWQSASRTVIPLIHDQPAGPFTEMMQSLGESRWPFPYQDEADAKKWFDAHNDSVRRSVPKQRLIEWNIGDGWLPICKALGMSTPDAPFPHANKVEDFENPAKD